MLFLFLHLLYLPLVLSQSFENFEPEDDYLDDGVMTKDGTRIMGRSTIFFSQVARAYLGIPYAKPPVGELRFKKPEPLEPKNGGVFIADTMPPACVQHSRINLPWYDSGEGQSEDCLYLNIWTGRFPPKKLQVPVLFWIYGGEFSVGSNRLDATDGTQLSVIGTSVVVSPNYRVGPMGFLSSGTEDAPGNVGIHDLIMALQWTKDHIDAFGGDPDRIAIMGQGSGSVTVSLFLLSPLTKGLYSRAIMQSGSLVGNVHVDPNRHNLKLGQRLAEEVGCADENKTLKAEPEMVVECLRTKDALKLAEIVSSFDPLSTRAFLPQYKDDFLPNDPVEDLKNKNFHPVPLLIGNTHDEGTYLLTTRNQYLFGPAGENDPKISKPTGTDLLRRTFAHMPDPDAVVDQYLGDVDDDDYHKIRRQVANALGDYATVCPSVFFAEKYSNTTEKNNTLYYVFDQRPSDSIWAPWMGVTFYDEVKFVFGRYLEGYDYERMNREYTGELGMAQFTMETWGDFAKDGRPFHEWKNFTSTHHQYLLIKNQAPKKMRGPGPHLDNCNFFRQHFGM
ncbi:hypothetical protein JTE90_013884 [Oedothorax gibbosus]|uniref:Carboxylesterase type B domain-containing protein n=1 Tax=Oedothorax gibbosus TaxID=931172 RepID=A0AAV6VG11_9ARAC|nr:hypothetical protein JTE90_013884 [Oedothorax gibbosus]